MRFVLKPKYTCVNKHPEMRTNMTKPSHFATILSLASFPHPCHSIHCNVDINNINNFNTNKTNTNHTGKTKGIFDLALWHNLQWLDH